MAQVPARVRVDGGWVSRAPSDRSTSCRPQLTSLLLSALRRAPPARARPDPPHLHPRTRLPSASPSVLHPGRHPWQPRQGARASQHPRQREVPAVRRVHPEPKEPTPGVPCACEGDGLGMPRIEDGGWEGPVPGLARSGLIFLFLRTIDESVLFSSPPPPSSLSGRHNNLIWKKRQDGGNCRRRGGKSS